MTTTETTTPDLRALLSLPLDEGNDSGATTVRGYLVKLLDTLWREEEGFDGKRPFGNSCWQSDLYVPLIKAGLISGALDEDGYLKECDDGAGCRLILAAIRSLGEAGPETPQEAAPSSPLPIFQLPPPVADFGPVRLELMGHRYRQGHLSEVVIAGQPFLRLDLEGGAVEFYQPQSVYCITPGIIPPAPPRTAITSRFADEAWGDEGDDDHDEMGTS